MGGGGRPPDLWVALPRPLAGRSPPPTWPPVTPGLVGGHGEGRGRGRSHCSPYLRSPIPLPQFFSCWAGWNSPPSQSPSLPGEGQGEGLHCSPYLRPSPTSPPREPRLRPHHAGVELPHAGGAFRHAGKLWRGRGEGTALLLANSICPPPPSPFAGRAETAASQGCIRRKRISHCSNQFKTITPYHTKCGNPHCGHGSL